MPESSISPWCRRAVKTSDAISPRSTRRRATSWHVREAPQASSFSQQPGLSCLGAIMLPSLGDAIIVAREAHLEQFNLLGRDRQKLAQRRCVHGAARVLLHLEAVEKHLRHAVDRDHAAMGAQQAIAMLAESLRDRVALLDSADVRRIRMTGAADEPEA